MCSDVTTTHPTPRSSNCNVLGSDRSSKIPSVETERPETREEPKQKDALGTATKTKKSQEAFAPAFKTLPTTRGLKIPGKVKGGKSGSPESSALKE